MFELKPLHHEAVSAALDRVKHYRLLNEPGAAESICLDILAIEPDNQDALINIVLAMSDRFGKDYAIGDGRITEFLGRIKGDYEQNYYTGIMYERRAKATLKKGGLGVYEMFTQAMDAFEKASAVRPAGNDDAILRWNGCARVINRNDLKPHQVSANDFIE